VPPLDAAHEYAVQYTSMLVGDALNSATCVAARHAISRLLDLSRITWRTSVAS
jgi:hypothetical protein